MGSRVIVEEVSDSVAEITALTGPGVIASAVVAAGFVAPVISAVARRFVSVAPASITATASVALPFTAATYQSYVAAIDTACWH